MQQGRKIMRENYINQVNLLLDVLPHVMQDNRFALKGGTAINLFYREMPRLSVDIDLCYLPIEDRSTSFKNIHNILKNISKKLQNLSFKVVPSKPLNGESEVKIFVSDKRARIKVEPNFTLRGPVFKPHIMTTTNIINHKFGKEVDANVLNFADVFGSKICAALDRQHPRDIFDIKYLLENEGLSENIRKSFIVYLISHPRPIHELLKPKIKDISNAFMNQFKGMTSIDIKLSELQQARDKLITDINETLTVSERNFLISFKNISPEWNTLGIEGIKNLPAVKWKLHNLKKMDQSKRKEQLQLLKEHLSS